MSIPIPSTITESIFITNDGYTIGNKNLDAVSSNTGGFVSMGSDGYSIHTMSTDGYGRQNVNINGLTSTSNFGYARGILIPGAIGTNYNVATACQAAFTAGSTSYKATYCQAFMSPGGGSQSITTVDGQTVVVPLVPGFVYSIFVTIFNSASSVSDLQIFI